MKPVYWIDEFRAREVQARLRTFQECIIGGEEHIDVGLLQRQPFKLGLSLAFAELQATSRFLGFARNDRA